MPCRVQISELAAGRRCSVRLGETRNSKILPSSHTASCYKPLHLHDDGHSRIWPAYSCARNKSARVTRSRDHHVCRLPSPRKPCWVCGKKSPISNRSALASPASTDMCSQIFKVVHQPDTIGTRLSEVQKASEDLATFGKMVSLVSLSPFSGTVEALAELSSVSEGILSDFLRATLESALPKASKKKNITLGVWDKSLAASIKAVFPNVSCETGDSSPVVAELLRGLRQHGKLIKQLQHGDLDRAVLGLGHAYSRSRVKFSVIRQDQSIIQVHISVFLCDAHELTFWSRPSQLSTRWTRT